MDPVAKTSRWMAAARARESKRPYRLFDDPLAAVLAGPEGFRWLDRMERAQPWAGPWGGPALYVVVRTRFFDDFLLRASRGAGARQVVLLAAGMDARAFRLGWPPGTRLYELDRPEVLEVKDEILARAGARPTCERRAIGADLRNPSWFEALSNAGYEAREPSVWLMEGLLFYMTEAAVRALLDDAGALAAPRSRLGADLVNEDLLASPAMQLLLATFLARCTGKLRRQRPGVALGRVRLGGGSDPTRRAGRQLRAVALPGGTSGGAGRPPGLLRARPARARSASHRGDPLGTSHPLGGRNPCEGSIFRPTK